MAGYTGNANLLASSIQYIINVLMTIPALIWLDRWGRRPTLIVGATLMMIWNFSNAGLFATYGVPVPGGIDGIAAESMRISGAPAKAVIASTYLFVASFAPTWGPVSWVYPPELYPLRLRGKAVALSTSANWAFNTALGAFVPPAFVSKSCQTVPTPESDTEPMTKISGGRLTSSSASLHSACSSTPSSSSQRLPEKLWKKSSSCSRIRKAFRVLELRRGRRRFNMSMLWRWNTARRRSMMTSTARRGSRRWRRRKRLEHGKTESKERCFRLLT